MANLQQLSESLHKLITSEAVLFISWPRPVDSTTFAKLVLKLTISSLDEQSVTLSITPENAVILLKLCEKLNEIKATPLLGHDLKELFTFYRRITGKGLILNNVFDLYWYESYLRLDSSKDDKLVGLSNFKKWLTNTKLMKLYKDIYQPLICRTLPAVESFAFYEEDLGQLVYPNYSVEGQENGRLSCSCSGKRCYNPHSLGPEKQNLKLTNSKDVMFQFDYRNMEVAVLAVLSNDSHLLSVVNQKETDVYSLIFKKVTGLENHDEARNLGKKMFLPVIYGQTANGLAKSLDISVDQSQIYFNKLYSIFPKTLDYVESFQDQAKKTGIICDYFDRKRSLCADEAYKARNFAIQSPAALICLESLVKLDIGNQGNYKLVFHVHDGYCIVCKQKDMQDVYHHAKSILEKSGEFMPELKLGVATKVGKSLDKMTTLTHKVQN